MARTLVGSRIRERREAHGLRQAELARMAGISPSYLNLIEHNRRGIAGRVLIALAAALDSDVAELSEGADRELQSALQSAATDDASQAELDRLDELIGRFPGWARLIAAQQRRLDHLEHGLEALSDQLAHDPFLAESLHEMLSSVTAIHATAGILAQSRTMEPLQQRRFQANIHEESSRLSDLSRAMVNHFDQLSKGGTIAATPLDEVEAFLTAHGYHFPDLETGNADAVPVLVEQSGDLQSQSGRHLAADVLAQYLEDAHLMPLAEFIPAASDCGFACGDLARQFRVPADAVYRRLAFLPKSADLPEFGLIACDGTGAVMLRKPLPGFALPRYGAACALWPLYQALNQPHVAVAALLETPDERQFGAEALATYLQAGRPNAPVAIRSTMLFQPAGHKADATPQFARRAVGLSCRICPRTDCDARREPSIHGPVAQGARE